MPRQLSGKTSLLLECQSLRPLVNILAADDKYPLLDRDNLRYQFTCNYLGNKKLFLNVFLHD